MANRRKSRLTDTEPSAIKFNRLDWILGILGLAAWGLSLIGMVTNLWLGPMVLLIAFGLIVYEFWRWSRSRHWHFVVRVITVILAGVLVMWSGSKQVITQYKEQHPVPSPSERPDFSVKIYQRFSAYYRSIDKTRMLLEMEITNSGSPSTTFDWRVHYKSSTMDADIPIVRFKDEKYTRYFSDEFSHRAGRFRSGVL